MLDVTHDTGAYTEKVTKYDKNGNIEKLQRYGNGLIDNLTYTYNGNQLTKVKDESGNASGFTDGASAENEYTYDHNGNLTKDSNKGITNIAYNCLNLPSTVTFSDGSTIVYSYAADGTKLRTVHTISGTTTQKDYCANVVYENGVQKLLLAEEGYVDLSASTLPYYYYLKDHQGNNRVVIDKDGAVKETNHYYPFGGLFDSGNEQPYKYNGKELDTKKGLNWYDYGARHYDATLGRWFVVDPLTEKMSSWSPYSYCFNNPVKFVDKNGMAPGPGDLFTTPRSAAKDWGWYYNGASIVRKREMGSSIYEVKKGKSLIGYSYTPATVGNAHGTGFSKPQNGENIVATIHSHGNYDGKIKTEDGSVGLVKDNEHSTADKSYNIQNETIGYLATPNGSLLEHNPKTGEIIVVTEKLPSDSNDPSRKNRTSATESSREVPFIEKIKDWIINFINN